jgi:CheY-like chemotaxis protein
LILVVDDFGGAREIYSRVLSSSGFQVAEATDGTEALEKGLSLKPDLIVLDLGLPGMDGLELIGRFKADPRTRNARIVVVTGAGYVDGERRARQAGCDAYLVKPCVPERLLSVVRDLVGPSSAPPRGA